MGCEIESQITLNYPYISLRTSALSHDVIFGRSLIQSSIDFNREAFRVFDREGHGFITVPDLIQVLTSLGDKLTQGEYDVIRV